MDLCIIFLMLFNLTSIKNNVTSKQFITKPKDSLSYSDCIFTNRFTYKDRLKKYPFSKAVKILAVSYHLPQNTSVGQQNTIANQGLVVKNKILDKRSLVEIVKLNDLQIASLTNVIYNTDFRKNTKTVSPGYNCFSPRNALIFLDKNGKVFDYIEICFECQNAESLSKRLNIGTQCTQKYDILKKYFISLGIKTGTLHH